MKERAFVRDVFNAALQLFWSLYLHNLTFNKEIFIKKNKIFNLKLARPVLRSS